MLFSLVFFLFLDGLFVLLCCAVLYSMLPCCPLYCTRKTDCPIPSRVVPQFGKKKKSEEGQVGGCKTAATFVIRSPFFGGVVLPFFGWVLFFGLFFLLWSFCFASSFSWGSFVFPFLTECPLLRPLFLLTLFYRSYDSTILGGFDGAAVLISYRTSKFL